MAGAKSARSQRTSPRLTGRCKPHEGDAMDMQDIPDTDPQETQEWLEALDGVRGEDSPGQPFDRDTKMTRAGSAADGVAAAHVITCIGRAQGHVLPMRKRVLGCEVGGHLELDDHRIVSQRLDRADPQRMNRRASMPGGRLRRRLRGQAVNAP